MAAGTVFPSFQAALEYLFKLGEKEKIILAIDEYPYVAKSSSSLASTLQLLIDKYKDSTKLKLILCGSSMSYMEDEVLAYKSPLYGRRTAQLKISPFEFSEICKSFSNFSDEDKALIYGVVGGTPQYLLQIDENNSMSENIKNIYLNPISFLYEEPVNLLKQEVREPALYMAIITAIANGTAKMSEIANKVGEPTSVCSSYLKSLIGLGIVKKETPYGEETSKKVLYEIEDNMFRFWYRFVLENNSLIERGGAEIVYKRIEPYFPEYMGKVFEEICKQYLWNKMITGECPVIFNSIGRWWGNNPKTRVQEEIDIMGAQDKSTALFGECKWTNEDVDLSVLDKLIERSHLFNYKNIFYYIFAKKGFTLGCKEKAYKMGNVKLISFGDLMKNI